MYRILTVLLLIPFTAVDLAAQDGDYPAFPRMDIDYLHLDLLLHVSEDLEIEGEALYEVETRRQGVDSLALNASGLEIHQVEWDGVELDYQFSGEELAIRLPENLERGTFAELRINYSTSPLFGIHRDEWGTIWSSLQRGSLRHWLPAFDHPRNSFTTKIRLTYPGGMSAVVNGLPGESGEEADGELYHYFETLSPVPATALTFAVGEFERSETQTGRYRIQLHSREGLLDQLARGNLLNTAAAAFENAELQTGAEYPWNVLHIVVLDDDRWETKQYGAGVVYLYQSQGDLARQLVRGISAQWYGVQLREEQWDDSDAVLLLQEWLGHNQVTLNNPQSEQTMLADPDSSLPFSAPYRERVHTFLNTGQNPVFQEVFRRVAPTVLRQIQGVINWHDFAMLLYEESGQPFFAPPEWPEAATEEETHYTYRVNYDLDEAAGELRLTFQAQGALVEELVPIRATEITVQERREREIAFTGGRDEVVLTVNSGIENLKLEHIGDLPVTLAEEKPLMFWVYQLRNDEGPEGRKEAAVGLRQYLDDPDLQLALLDLLRGEENEFVIAEILRTLADITQGASGTQQIFLERYRADAPREHQQAIVYAYNNYPGQEAVITSLRGIILETPHTAVQEDAVQALASMTEPDRYLEITQALIQREEAIPVVPVLLQLLAGKGEEERAVSMANALLNPGYSYTLRSSGLQLLLEFDQSAQGWGGRLPDLLSDRDPRIRYRAIEGVRHLDGPARSNLLEERLLEESDPRVRNRLSQY
ncbi:MAG: hypothetical protein WD355_00585 [Balneolaceae bacterium]